VFLARDLLDKQMVDLEGYKIVRVNDIRLAWSGRDLRVIGADIGFLAVLRRLGLGSIAEMLRDVRKVPVGEQRIPWNLISRLEPMPDDLRLRVPYSEFRRIHPSDIADIIEQLDVDQRAKVLALVDDPQAAEVLSQIIPAMRTSVAESMDDEHLSDLLEIMPPDEAADILGSLTREKAQALLALMGIEEASTVSELLGYDPMSAGGKMTTEFVAVPDYLTADQAIETLRERGAEAETIYYIYVVDRDGHLSGVLSLRDLLRAPSDEAIGRIMMRDVITTDVDDDQELVADKLARYNLLAVPVVDHDHVLKGIVTVDDAIDVMRQESSEDLSQLSGVVLAEEGGLPRGVMDARRWAGTMFTFLGGILATALFGLFKQEFVTATALVLFVPLALRSSHDVSFWSLAMSLSEMPEGRTSRSGLGRFLAREYVYTIAAAMLTGGLALALGRIWTGSQPALVAGASGLFVGVSIAGLLGLMAPVLVRKARLDPAIAPGRLLGVAVIAVSMIFFLLTSNLVLKAMG
jgi:Mg2+ transporter MgtE